ncbi:hypothetical protein ACLPBM_20435 [Escherichia coli]|uniref:hypothetical protein n=1 Tax=Enterobacterales TaxID=91347 RepID=UPI0038912CBB
MSKFELGQRVKSTWGGDNPDIVVARGDDGVLAGYEDNPAVQEYVECFVSDPDDFVVLFDDDGECGYGYDGDGDFEAE